MKKMLLTATLIALSTGAFAADHIERQVYQDPGFEQNRAKAVKMLEARGYKVVDIDADDHMGKPALDVEAFKGNQEYDIKLSYPDLRILQERPDRK
ncbi:PepSY domain-containing protein [Neisseria wadsworthii]|uniref:PepSY domain-containing protein n=1 Tax=Neisseria wadsworthii 9715 TaxID=1030841 RepID=G4CSM4_9NEIS|nr:PepSY domain-containing protein [Neisseria wadsworthii]EGZ44580.1 hypothetical protein HMPREF9370_2106 [Neisseria wadsworthii 9715]QMT35724.1 PepSY domain-containing protein [Neisseria wadsworthii]